MSQRKPWAGTKTESRNDLGYCVEENVKWHYLFIFAKIILTNKEQRWFHQYPCSEHFFKAFKNWAFAFIYENEGLNLSGVWNQTHVFEPPAVPCKHLNNTKATQGKLWWETMLFFLQHNALTESLLTSSVALLGTAECILVSWIKWQKRQGGGEIEVVVGPAFLSICPIKKQVVIQIHFSFYTHMNKSAFSSILVLTSNQSGCTTVTRFSKW